MRLLLVEDDRDLNRQLATALEKAGYAIDRAYDGEEGGFLGETEPYDAVILDLGLPVKDGVTILKEWRAAGKIMPVIALIPMNCVDQRIARFFFHLVIAIVFLLC